MVEIFYLQMHFPLTNLYGGRQPDFLKTLKIMIYYKYNKHLLVVVTKQDTKNFTPHTGPSLRKWGK